MSLPSFVVFFPIITTYFAVPASCLTLVIVNSEGQPLHNVPVTTRSTTTHTTRHFDCSGPTIIDEEDDIQIVEIANVIVYTRLASEGDDDEVRVVLTRTEELRVLRYNRFRYVLSDWLVPGRFLWLHISLTIVLLFVSKINFIIR
eukprot:PhF_6_TR36685/c0_g1_i1/m.54067